MRAVIFDFDGLMVDTESPAYDAWCAIYQRFGVELDLERWVACVGSGHGAFDPVVHLRELTGQDHDRQELMAEKDRRKREVCQKLPALHGVRERLAEARRLQWAVAVASSSSRPWVIGHLERLELDREIDLLKTREDVQRVKPDPELCLAPAQCLVFEDSLNGVRAAKAAGMICIAIPNGITQGLDFSMADGVFSSLAQVSLSGFLSR